MKSLRRWFEKRQANRSAERHRSRKSRPGLELLESRVVLYSATGNAWLNPQIVTISFMPDGTSLGRHPSNMISTFNNNPGLNGKWQNVILQAAQTSAQQTNINFVVVPDDGTPSGGGNYQEGAPGFGDIRIGGYNFGTSTLGWTYQPPTVNNFSIAGDIMLNTGVTWNIGTTYDLFTVAAHEFGHALGLGQSSAGGNAIMWPTYTGRKKALAADDIAGIQSIYSANGPRTPDYYGGLNTTFTTAANLDSQINNGSRTALAPNLDIAAAGQTEFFSVDAPAGTSDTMQVTAQSLGLSLLAPKMTVYAADEATVLGSANGAGQYGTTLTATIPNVTKGQRFYVEVQGADTSAFGTGNYALGLSFKGSTPPAEASPIIAYANGQTLHSGGGSAQEQADPYGGLTGGPPNILGISPDTGTSNSDGITNANRISIVGVAANNEMITVYNNGIAIGTTVADAGGQWTFDNTGTALADGTYTFSATATDSNGNVSALSLPFGVTIDTSTPAPPTIGGIAGGIATGSNSATTADSTPVFFGTARPYSQVSLYQGLTCLGNVAADGNGHWSFADSTSSLQANGSYAFTALDTDVAGNTSSQSAVYSVNVVTPPSSAPAVNVSSGALDQQPPQLPRHRIACKLCHPRRGDGQQHAPDHQRHDQRKRRGRQHGERL